MGDKPSIERVIAHVAAAQHGNVTRSQLSELGLGGDAIDYRLRTGRLFRVYPGVYGVGHPPVEPLERAMAAVLACGPRAALSHGSAMTLWGFWKRWDHPFDLTTAGDRRPRGVRIHRSKTLLGKDIKTRDRIPVTSAARTLLDMAPHIPPKSLTRFINDGRLTHRVTLEALADIANRNPGHPGARMLKPHAENTQNATRSGGEDDFEVFCRRYGLPIPEINFKLHGYEVDAYFPQEKLVVELDGWPYHRTRVKFETDREQDATMLMHRIATIRITYARMEVDPDREATRLQRILESRRG